MRADKVLTVMAAAVATAVVALASAPSEAQTPEPGAQARVIRTHHPARVTVRKRSYLDPGTETKRRAEHYQDYIYSPVHGMAPMRNSTLFQSGPGLPFVHDRMPFPNCLDLAGFCQ
jgi:hypothetical protein